MSDIPCLDAAERAKREEVLLSHLGRPSEDYAARVLATCGGRKTVEPLETAHASFSILLDGWRRAGLDPEVEALRSDEWGRSRSSDVLENDGVRGRAALAMTA